MTSSMCKDEFLETGAMYAKTLTEAMERYEYAVLSGREKEYMRLFLEKVMEKNKDASYADFYFSMLKPEEQKRVQEELSETELIEFFKFDVSKQQIFYKICQDSATFLFEVTARNSLFSTFYFANKKAMIWGNYDLKFPLFCEEKEVLKEYLLLADDCGLEIER